MNERLSKVAEEIKREVARILQQELKDPRIGFVTITQVTVSPDLEHAVVYYSLLEGHGDPAQTQKGLESSKGFVRRLLGERVRIRVTPDLSFRLDKSIAESIRISKLLNDINKPSTP